MLAFYYFHRDTVKISLFIWYTDNIQTSRKRWCCYYENDVCTIVHVSNFIVPKILLKGEAEYFNCLELESFEFKKQVFSVHIHSTMSISLIAPVYRVLQSRQSYILFLLYLFSIFLLLSYVIVIYYPFENSL